ncbi:type I pantothenate kinase [Vibrio sp. SS-MA-C1-2]|uniref:type I pantothenate kinase n=1 Tax=Vibrio sp. SS-MA-C1-2 TaxID=2908646 RepID=UPI001F1BAB66|nr:type I pantothenate kinase [Vibrio sp. SS-MA-C1-2]UJF19191.1 type I pantothenate kinase [Vibrio sp. SS-MA-C1-2]
MIDNMMTTPYLSFNRQQWAELRNTVPMTLTEEELDALRGINDRISLDEVVDIYLPLSRLLNLYVQAKQRRTIVQEKFLSTSEPKIPYIIGIAGSVAVGKSTTARLLQTLLTRWPEHPKVELITTDGFLKPNKVLEEQGIMGKKGFPESYNMHQLVKFVSDIKSGKEQVHAPVYSHLVYDIIPDQTKTVEQPDILIIEGLNVLQSGMDYPHDPHRVFISDFLDFSLYVDAEVELLEKWYVDRFMKFRAGAFTDPNAYFHHYTKLTEIEATTKAKSIWAEINGKNLLQNILPTKERADLVLTKGSHHAIQQVKLRK